MNKLDNYIKPSVIALSPYSSARDEYHGTEGLFLDANENTHDFDYNRYPDPYQRNLKFAISEWRSVDNKCIFLGNGSDEIIDLLIRVTCETGVHRILSLDPSYGMYQVSASINSIEIDLVAMNTDLTINEASLFESLTDAHRLVFICSPNNPNGGVVDANLIKSLLDKTNGFVVVDEAYIDFSDSKSWIYQLSEYPNLIVLQTMSKAMGAAGLRLGMGFMNPYLVSILNKVKPPYNISTPNQELALARIKDLLAVLESIIRIKEERARLIEQLNEMRLVDYVFPSEANFVLVRFIHHDRVLSLLRDQNIIVRDRSSHRYCKDCIRISIGQKFENDQLVNALKILENE